MCIICQIYLDFHSRNEGPSCLKGACGCVNTNIYKKCLSNIFKLFFKSNILKYPTLILLRGVPVDPNPHFLGTVKLNQNMGRKVS